MRRWSRFAISTISVALGLQSITARGLCGAPPVRVDDEFFRSTAIFIGTPIAEKHLPSEDEWLETIYTVQPTTWLRGHLEGPIEMRTENDSGRFSLTPGKPNLIFLQKNDRGWYIADGCGHTNILSKAQRTLGQVRQLPHKGVSYLYGGCINGDCGGDLVVATSGKDTWRARVNGHGRFVLRVPPGSYRVRMQSMNRNWVGYILSYNPPEHVVVPDGGSAGVSFEAGSD